MENRPLWAVIGGTGFYDLPGLTHLETVEAQTPFGAPSAPIRIGNLADGGPRVAFLARHGIHHTLLPSEINARANIFALKNLGVQRVLAVSAVGSLQESIAPGHWVIPSQFVDRTHGRPGTFFGDGLVAHANFSDPVCPQLRTALFSAAAQVGTAHDDATYLCIEGPQFSTRAESRLWRQWGAHVVGMTALPEARLAREAELCYALLGLPTDYDAWRAGDTGATAAEVRAQQQHNLLFARNIMHGLLRGFDRVRDCPCAHSLDNALLTPNQHIPVAVRARLKPLLERFWQKHGALAHNGAG